MKSLAWTSTSAKSRTRRAGRTDRDVEHDPRHARRQEEGHLRRADGRDELGDVLADDGLLYMENGNPFFGGLSAGYERTERWSNDDFEYDFSQLLNCFTLTPPSSLLPSLAEDNLVMDLRIIHQ